MFKHLIFALIGVLAMCMPRTAHAEEEETGRSVFVRDNIVILIQTGDEEYTSIAGYSAKKIEVEYDKTTVQDIVDQLTLPDPTLFEKVSSSEGDDNDEWYYWDETGTGWSPSPASATTFKAKDTVNKNTFGKYGTKAIGAVYKYKKELKVKVVNEEGEDLYELDLSKVADIAYTPEYPCCYVEKKSDDGWVYDCYLLRLKRMVFDSSINPEDYRIKLSHNHSIINNTYCNKCGKHIITKADDIDKLWNNNYQYFQLSSSQISIESDIDYSEYTPKTNLLPIAYYAGVVVNGNNYTLSNYKGNFPLGDLRYIETHTIKNLAIKNFDITISDKYFNSEEDNIYVKILGDNNYISNCSFSGIVRIEGEIAEGKNYIPCLGINNITCNNTFVDITTILGEKETKNVILNNNGKNEYNNIVVVNDGKDATDGNGVFYTDSKEANSPKWTYALNFKGNEYNGFWSASDNGPVIDPKNATVMIDIAISDSEKHLKYYANNGSDITVNFEGIVEWCKVNGVTVALNETSDGATFTVENANNGTISVEIKYASSTEIADVNSDNSIYVRGKKIYSSEDIRIYDLMGKDVTERNGMLDKGIYIVKGSTTSKIMVK